MTNMQNNQDKTMTIDHHHQNHNNYNIDHGAGRVPRETLENIAALYADVIGPLNFILAKKLETILESGVEAQTLMLAIQETALAPRPSFFYMQAVLRNWITTGVKVSRNTDTVLPLTDDARPWWKPAP